MSFLRSPSIAHYRLLPQNGYPTKVATAFRELDRLPDLLTMATTNIPVLMRAIYQFFKEYDQALEVAHLDLPDEHRHALHAAYSAMNTMAEKFLYVSADIHANNEVLTLQSNINDFYNSKILSFNNYHAPSP
jgi:hypothetical protein